MALIFDDTDWVLQCYYLSIIADFHFIQTVSCQLVDVAGIAADHLSPEGFMCGISVVYTTSGKRWQLFTAGIDQHHAHHFFAVLHDKILTGEVDIEISIRFGSECIGFGIVRICAQFVNNGWSLPWK